MAALITAARSDRSGVDAAGWLCWTILAGAVRLLNRPSCMPLQSTDCWMWRCSHAAAPEAALLDHAAIGQWRDDAGRGRGASPMSER